MDPAYEPPEVETRQVYGLYMQQKRNNVQITEELFNNIVSKNKDVSAFFRFLTFFFHA